jgi:hypothetical protein
MERLMQYKPLLMVLHEATPKLRMAIMRNAPDDLIKCIIEVTLNFLQDNIRTDNATLLKLKQRKSKVRRFSRLRGEKGVRKARKQLLHTGGLLPFLIPLLTGLQMLKRTNDCDM